MYKDHALKLMTRIYVSLVWVCTDNKLVFMYNTCTKNTNATSLILFKWIFFIKIYKVKGILYALVQFQLYRL